MQQHDVQKGCDMLVHISCSSLSLQYGKFLNTAQDVDCVVRYVSSSGGIRVLRTHYFLIKIKAGSLFGLQNNLGIFLGQKGQVLNRYREQFTSIGSRGRLTIHCAPLVL